MKIKPIPKALTFADVSLVPGYSSLESRQDVTLNTTLGPDSKELKLGIPIISSPMDTVTDSSMARFMDSYGGMGIIHRYMDTKRQVEEVELILEGPGVPNVGAAIGVNGDSWERTQALVDAGVSLLVLDVAHGHTYQALRRIQKIKETFPETVLMSANICTARAAEDCLNAGADVLRVGVGGGSACTTRVVAGCGVPQITALQEVLKVVMERWTTGPKPASIVCDGGMKTSGDIVKALAAGADAVMLGGMLAPFLVSAGETVLVNTGQPSQLDRLIKGWVDSGIEDAQKVFSEGVAKLDFGSQIIKKKRFRGMASDSALAEHKNGEAYIVEGEEFLIDIDYDFEQTFEGILDGIRLGLSYLGCSAISEIGSAEFIEITANGLEEASPHYSNEGVI